MPTRAEMREVNARQAAAISLEIELATLSDHLEAERDAQKAICALDMGQQEMLRLWCNGLADKDVAEHYKRHESSVRRSKSRICQQLGAQNLAEACYKAGIAGFR